MGNIREKIKRGGKAIMVDLRFNSPTLVENLGALGFDAVMLDCEHTSASVERIEELARAARVAGIVPIVRPEKLDDALITRYLDCKAGGIMIPHVDDAATARRIVETVRYAMEGRGEGVLTLAMLESKEAVANIDEILAVPGIDLFFLARVDLSKSLGFGGDRHHPEVRAVVDRLIDKVRSAGRLVAAAGDYPMATEIAAKVDLVYVSAKSIFEFGAKAYQERVNAAGTRKV